MDWGKLPKLNAIVLTGCLLSLLVGCVVSVPLHHTPSSVRSPETVFVTTDQQATLVYAGSTEQLRLRITRPEFRILDINFFLNTIQKVKGYVWSGDLPEKIWNQEGLIPFQTGQNLTIDAIPKGTNRLVSVWGYDAQNKPLDYISGYYSSTVKTREVKTVYLRRRNNVLADVMEKLIVARSPLANTLAVEPLQSKIEQVLYTGNANTFAVEPRHIPTASLVQDLLNGTSIEALKIVPVVYTPFSFYVNQGFARGVKISVNDPATPVMQLNAGELNSPSKPLLPGNWTVRYELVTQTGIGSFVESEPLTVSEAGVVTMMRGTQANPITFGPVIVGFTDNLTQALTGQSITLEGGGFNPVAANNTVTIGGVNATIVTGNSMSLTVRVPYEISGNLPVQVNNGTASSNTVHLNVAIGPPNLTTLTPNSGSPANIITITGGNFANVAAGNTVRFNGVAATVLSATVTELKVTGFTGATTGPVTVMVNGQTSNALNFTVQAPQTVTQSSIALVNPYGVTFNTKDNQLYIANIYNGTTIDRMASDGTISTFVTGLDGPADLASDSDGNIYVAEYRFSLLGTRILKITPNGTVTTIANTPMTGVVGIAIDGDRNLYVNYHIASSPIHKIAPNGTVTLYSSSNIPSHPEGMAWDSTGNLYVTSGNGFVYKVAPNGAVSIFAAVGGDLEDIVVDSQNNLYVSHWNNGVYKITPAGVVSAFYAVPGVTTGYHGLEFDAARNLYLSNQVTRLIYKITAW